MKTIIIIFGIIGLLLAFSFSFSVLAIEEDPMLKLVNKVTKQHFDLCLPIKKHINDTDPRFVTSPIACAQLLGVAKDGCTNNPTYEYCNDPLQGFKWVHGNTTPEYY